MQEQYKRMEFDEDLLPMIKKHRKKASQELERLLEMEPSAGVEQAMVPVILTLMGAEFLEEHAGRTPRHGKREPEDGEEGHTRGYPMSR